MTKKNILLFLISTTAIIIIINFYFFVTEKSLSQYADWLINYQGGFVRRGLIGEFFFQLYKITTIRLDFIIFFLVSFFYIFFFKNFYEIIKNVKFNLINFLIIFAPFSFFYPVMEEKVSGRKDILFLFLLSFLCIYLKKINFFNQKYLIIIFSIILIFSHTGFLFFLPNFIILFLLINNSKKLSLLFKETTLIILSILISIFIIYFNKSISYDNILLICESVTNFVRSDCASNGYISTLSWSLEYNLLLKDKLWIADNYNIFFLKAFIFGFIPFVITLFFSKIIKHPRINIFIIFFINFILSLPLYYMGSDYGRYMNISYLSMIMIYFHSINEKIIITDFPKINFFKKTNLNYALVVIIVFLYGFTFTIPHCCNNKFKFVYSNLIEKIIEKIEQKN